MKAYHAGHIAIPGDQWTKINKPRWKRRRHLNLTLLRGLGKGEKSHHVKCFYSKDGFPFSLFDEPCKVSKIIPVEENGTFIPVCQSGNLIDGFFEAISGKGWDFAGQDLVGYRLWGKVSGRLWKNKIDKANSRKDYKDEIKGPSFKTCSYSRYMQVYTRKTTFNSTHNHFWCSIAIHIIINMSNWALSTQPQELPCQTDK